MEQMPRAQQAVRDAATKIPSEISARFETTARLADADRQAIVEFAHKALLPFQAKAKP